MFSIVNASLASNSVSTPPGATGNPWAASRGADDVAEGVHDLLDLEQGLRLRHRGRAGRPVGRHEQELVERGDLGREIVDGSQFGLAGLISVIRAAVLVLRSGIKVHRE